MLPFTNIDFFFLLFRFIDIYSIFSDQELREAKYFIEKLEKELRVRDDIIHELEVRLTLPSNSDDLLNCSSEDTIDYTIEIKNLQTQLEALQKALAHKDNEIDALNIALENRAQGKK